MTDEHDELDDELDELDDADLDGDTATHGMSGRTGFLSGLIVGALIGAGVALLAAPQGGAETRRRLSRGVRKLADDTRGQVEDWADDAKRELRRKRRRLRKRLRR